MMPIARALKRSKVRYLLVGGTSFTIEYLSFILMLKFSGLIILANSLSFIIGLCISFILNRHWSFKGKHKQTIRTQAIGYVLLATFNIFLTNIIVYTLVSFTDLDPGLAKVASMAAIVVWNYYIMNNILFQRTADGKLQGNRPLD